MISKQAVHDFLQSPCLDSVTAKRLGANRPDDIRRRLEAVRPTFDFVLQPRIHQAVCILLGVKHPSYGFWLDMGGGKTMVALTLLRWRIVRGEVQRGLILVPQRSNVAEWREQAAVHRPDLTFDGLDGDAPSRRAILENPAQIVCMTYQGFLSIICTRKPSPDRGWIIVVEWLEQLMSHFQFVVQDESDVVGNHQTLLFKALNKARNFAPFWYQLTGTPFAKDPHVLWPQLYLLDRGETLGKTLGIFRGAFFTTRPGWFGGYEHVFLKSMDGTLHRRLRNRTVRYRDDEFSELPPMVGGIFTEGGPQLVKCLLSSEAESHYQLALRRSAEHDPDDRQQRENLWYRTRCITAGYLTETADDGTKLVLRFAENFKLEALVAALLRVPSDRKAVVFCVYLETANLIMDGLKAAKIKAARITGKMTQETVNKALDSFKRGTTRVLVGNQAIARGLNLQVANYAFFYESPPDPRVRRQMEKRLQRGDQKEHVYVYDLVVSGTVDVGVVSALKEGRDLFVDVIEGRACLTG